MKFKKAVDVLVENWPAKVLSLAFALVLAQFYKGSLLERKYLSVPLTIENASELVSGVMLPKTVKISLWGEAAGIASIREDDIAAYLDFSAFDSEGNYQVPVQTRKRGMALNVSPLEISVLPSELDIKLEKKLSKKVDVKLSLRGIPSEGYEIYETSVDPATVEISGPSSVISSMSDVFTNNVLMESRKTGFSGYIDILRTNSLISIAGTGKIAYSVKIREVLNARTYDGISLYFENLDDSLEIVSAIPAGRITVRGAKSLLASWTPPANVLTVSCADISQPGIYSLPVRPAVLGKASLVEAEPKNVQIEVKLRNRKKGKR